MIMRHLLLILALTLSVAATQYAIAGALNQLQALDAQLSKLAQSTVASAAEMQTESGQSAADQLSGG